MRPFRHANQLLSHVLHPWFQGAGYGMRCEGRLNELFSADIGYHTLISQCFWVDGNLDLQRKPC